MLYRDLDTDDSGVYALYVCLICTPNMYALYVRLKRNTPSPPTTITLVFVHPHKLSHSFQNKFYRFSVDSTLYRTHSLDIELTLTNSHVAGGLNYEEFRTNIRNLPGGSRIRVTR